MSLAEQFCDAQQWVATHFSRVQLGDVRRRQRVCTLVAGRVRQPGAGIPQLGAGVPYDSKAAYSLLGRTGVTPEMLQGPHRQDVAAQFLQPGTYLLTQVANYKPAWCKVWAKMNKAIFNANPSAVTV